MPERPTLDEIRTAARRLRGVVRRTPVIPFHDFEPRARGPLLKLETLQPVTSFKIRGVFNAVACMTNDQRQKGLSTVSAGNTAQALAWAGRYFGVPARCLMPETAPATKIEAVERYGGQPVLVPVAELFRFLEERGWEKEPYAFVHPWTNRDLMVGHGTLGLEIVEDVEDLTAVYVPVGGGGLIGGVASAVKALAPEVRVIAVEPEGCPALHESMKRGAPARVDCRTICDGVAVPYITDEVFAVLRGIVDDVVLVAEDAVRAMVRRLALRERLVVEPSGALAPAAALEAAHDDDATVVAIVTGASIDTRTFRELL